MYQRNGSFVFFGLSLTIDWSTWSRDRKPVYCCWKQPLGLKEIKIPISWNHLIFISTDTGATMLLLYLLHINSTWIWLDTHICTHTFVPHPPTHSPNDWLRSSTQWPTPLTDYILLCNNDIITLFDYTHVYPPKDHFRICFCVVLNVLVLYMIFVKNICFIYNYYANFVLRPSPPSLSVSPFSPPTSLVLFLFTAKIFKFCLHICQNYYWLSIRHCSTLYYFHVAHYYIIFLSLYTSAEHWKKMYVLLLLSSIYV